MSDNKETEILLSKLSEIKDIGLPIDIASPKTDNQFDETINTILKLLGGDWINRVAGYFSNHRSISEFSFLDDEYKIQDLVYTMTSAFIPDLHFENPQPKNLGAITSTRIDFSSKKNFLFIEVKHANDKHQAKAIEKEISEDIVKYGKGKLFRHLIFFIYCYNYHFPNSRDFEKNFTSSEIISGHKINTYCIIKS